MRKKIVIYSISECPITASNEDFINNICTFVSDKKHIQDYIINRSIIKNWSHYNAWLKCHDKQDDKKSRYEYIIMCLGWEETFNKFCVKKQVYNSDGIATILRIMNRCLPVGAEYESEDEINILTNYFSEIMDEVKNNVDLSTQS